ncbi:N-acetylglucosaminyl deacetylase, LmbE family [Nannocystis exedens]|uniref:N-acetylglucosaminyl deacetylase, LmbE family n=1 Tax=Nannocystis exedens TaxID=54 RepID=A0A1I2IJB1_9BACT|nr:PIG-L family deacetylase [Nannocystis exedens]PCC73668.1 2'-N-acetylparomamine deacetylase [Nannocystis exedens]SFF40946.1 N-acetylglucosaminyl deacetylase, LmbE family [Nannocystis exedens]
MTVLVVSPHLDDAVLSLPAWLAARARVERVVVATVFSEGDAGYPARRAEDVAALSRLGAEPLHLGLLDAPERRGLPRSFRALVLGEVDAVDAAVVARAIVAAVTRVAPEVVLLPLGVGEHLDHRVVQAAHASVAGRVGFYEDRPYALVRHAVRARLRRIGAVIDGEPVAPAPAEEYLASARAAAFVQAYLPADEREACLAPLAAMLSAPTPPELPLRREEHVFAALDLRAGPAVRAYASQLDALFGAADPAAALLGDAPHVESIWWRSASAGSPAAPTRASTG